MTIFSVLSIQYSSYWTEFIINWTPIIVCSNPLKYKDFNISNLQMTVVLEHHLLNGDELAVHATIAEAGQAALGGIVGTFVCREQRVRGEVTVDDVLLPHTYLQV